MIWLGFAAGIVIMFIIMLPKTIKTAKYNSNIEKLNEQLSKDYEKKSIQLEEIKQNVHDFEKEKERITNSINDLSQQAKQASEVFYNQSMKEAELKLEIDLKEKKEKFEQAKQDCSNEYLELLNNFQNEAKEIIEKYSTEEDEIIKAVQEIKATRNALIEASIREKEIEEQKDFYCIKLDPDEESDIEVLEKVKNKLNNPRILSMLIWQTYIRAKINRLCANVLGDKAVTGIYKITSLNTKECYIGQAKNIAERWKTHCKCGLGIDTPKGNKLYAAMIDEGIQNFSFELLESLSETLDDKELTQWLNNKEAHYIELYNSYNYGYNSTQGNN